MWRGREGGRKRREKGRGGREGGRERGREGGREGEREGGRERRKIRRIRGGSNLKVLWGDTLWYLFKERLHHFNKLHRLHHIKYLLQLIEEHDLFRTVHLRPELEQSCNHLQCNTISSREESIYPMTLCLGWCTSVCVYFTKSHILLYVSTACDPSSCVKYDKY